jgi:hypothetical protein
MIPEGKLEKLHLLPDGRFVMADDVRAVDSNFFQGVALSDEVKLPVGFAVKRGVNRFKVTDGTASKTSELPPLTTIHLTGKFRTVSGEKLWATEEGDYVRHRDITVINKREALPEFATGDQKWVDISIVAETATFYEGKKPVYVTLISAGRDRFGDPKQSASTQLGIHTIVAKSITSNEAGTKPFAEEYDLRDVPWVMELSSGQTMHGAYWHNRFGIEHGLGNLQLSPPDAAFLFRWSDLQVPQGWHSYRLNSDQDKKTLVLVRK